MPEEEGNEQTKEQTEKKAEEKSAIKPSVGSEALAQGGKLVLAAVNKATTQQLIPIVILGLLFLAALAVAIISILQGYAIAGVIVFVLFFIFFVLAFLKVVPLLYKEAEEKARETSATEFAENVAKKAPPQQDEQGKQLVEVPPIKGQWRATHYWTDPNTQEQQKFYETVEVTNQAGRSVEGTVRDNDGQQSRFQGLLFNRMLVMYSVSERSDRVSCGSATLQISPNTKSMSGHCIYFAIDLGALVLSKYDLQKVE